ncbi:hypothetical protein JCM31826_14940 [Thermaurantimonas aggregans]|uniref:CRISPR-associated protein n=1 Tax=Thermaurantimonas aggregans TaxID=2173829 RepID=A0A401XLY8_9FLAO|nr:hypothetical protein [Thermaurantimonas aggregans]MCX8149511.1 hypothetical protein [Thermaurantimonas aggregans]GCD78012.1 hypothetical protein JCM31826_14940 [Thermaurantimonas aggregans]
MTLINISNHPSAQWSARQRQTAKNSFGEIVDEPFPVVDPSWTSEQIIDEVERFIDMLKTKYDPLYALAFHVMGEFTFCLALVARLIDLGAEVYASTTQRRVVEEAFGDVTRKVTLFEFVQFRKYSL